MLPALEAMKKTQQELGQSGPRVVFTDNPSRDAQFYRNVFESVNETQAAMNKIALERNKCLTAECGIEYPHSRLSRIDTARQAAAHKAVPHEKSAVEEEDNTTRVTQSIVDFDPSSIWIESSGDRIGDACDVIRELVANDPVCSLDLKWDVQRDSRGSYGHRKTLNCMKLACMLEVVMLYRMPEFLLPTLLLLCYMKSWTSLMMCAAPQSGQTRS